MSVVTFTDDELLAAVRKYGNAWTYVVRNVLSNNRHDLKVYTVRRRLEKLEKQGLVKRTFTNSGTHICWMTA